MPSDLSCPIRSASLHLAVALSVASLVLLFHLAKVPLWVLLYHLFPRPHRRHPCYVCHDVDLNESLVLPFLASCPPRKCERSLHSASPFASSPLPSRLLPSHCLLLGVFHVATLVLPIFGQKPLRSTRSFPFLTSLFFRPTADHVSSRHASKLFWIIFSHSRYSRFHGLVSFC